jgi:hypothetical protein
MDGREFVESIYRAQLFAFEISDTSRQLTGGSELLHRTIDCHVNSAIDRKHLKTSAFDSPSLCVSASLVHSDSPNDSYRLQLLSSRSMDLSVCRRDPLHLQFGSSKSPCSASQQFECVFSGKSNRHDDNPVGFFLAINIGIFCF